jgi:hypothetical protein
MAFLLKRNVLSILALLLSSIITAQSVFQVGNGSVVTSGYPFLANPNAYQYSRACAIYTNSELSSAGITAGNITGIAWNKLAGPTFTGNLKIYLKNVSTTSYSGSVNWTTAINGAALVFDSTATNMNAISNWINKSFSTPFNWNGSSNIQVMVQFERIASNGNGNIAYNGVNTGSGVNAYTAGESSFVSNLVVIENSRTNTRFITNGSPCNINSSFAPSSINICAGDTVFFSNASVGATTYKWKENGLLFSTSLNANRVFNNAGSYTILLYAANGVCADSTSINITVNQLTTPLVTIAQNPAGAICSGKCITFEAASNNSGNLPTFNWLVNDIPVGQSAPSYTTCSANDGDIVSVYMVSNAACLTNDTAFSNSLVCNINPLPEPPVITQVDSTLYSSYTLGNSWYEIGNSNSLSLNANFIPQQSGNYFVVYTDNNGCSSLSDTIFYMISSISNTYADNVLKIYPNPACNLITLSNSNLDPILFLKITNNKGQVVYTSTSCSSIDIGFLPNGLYNIYAYSKRYFYLERLIVIGH